MKEPWDNQRNQANERTRQPEWDRSTLDLVSPLFTVRARKSDSKRRFFLSAIEHKPTSQLHLHSTKAEYEMQPMKENIKELNTI